MNAESATVTSNTWLVLPVPTFMFAILVGIVQLFLIGGISMLLELEPTAPAVMAGEVLASVAIYTALLALAARGDPRAWRNGDWLRRQAAEGHALTPIDRALIWDQASTAMGRQAGCLAGLVAASAMTLESELRGAIAFVLVGGVVGLGVHLAVSLPDRRALRPLLPIGEADS